MLDKLNIRSKYDLKGGILERFSERSSQAGYGPNISHSELTKQLKQQSESKRFSTFMIREQEFQRKNLGMT